MATSGGRALPPGPANLVETAITNPAAGADFTWTVTQAGLLLAVNGQLVTSATVISRDVTLLVADASANRIYTGPLVVSQTASETYTYTFQGAPILSGVVPNIVGAIPLNAYVKAGWTVSSSTLDLQTGDQWSAITILMAV